MIVISFVADLPSPLQTAAVGYRELPLPHEGTRARPALDALHSHHLAQ